MRRDEGTTPEDLNRPDGNSLLDNYELHDVGEEHFVELAEEMGLEVEAWGIDERHDDGEEGIIYDNKMDFKLYNEVSIGVGVSERQLVAIVDVKTKSSPRYMGRYNKRHFDKYREVAEEHEVPTFVIMYQVGYDDEIYDVFVHDLTQSDGTVYTSKDSDAVSNFPDGNHAVLVKHKFREDLEYFWEEVML